MDLHEFPEVLEKSECRTQPPPKLCAGLTDTIALLSAAILHSRPGRTPSARLTVGLSPMLWYVETYLAPP